MSVRLAAVDDRALLRAGLHSVIAIPFVAECATISEARARLVLARPTVTIVRARLPDGSGLELCRWLRTSLPDNRTLILHHGATRRDLVEAIDAGAGGIVTEDIALADLREAIARLGAGHSLLDGSALSRLAATLPSGSHQLSSDQLNRLTNRQLEIAERVGAGLRNIDIADELGLAEQTVKNQVSRILATLGFERRAQLARALGAQTKVEAR